MSYGVPYSCTNICVLTDEWHMAFHIHVLFKIIVKLELNLYPFAGSSRTTHLRKLTEYTFCHIHVTYDFAKFGSTY